MWPSNDFYSIYDLFQDKQRQLVLNTTGVHSNYYTVRELQRSAL